MEKISPYHDMQTFFKNDLTATKEIYGEFFKNSLAHLTTKTEEQEKLFLKRAKKSGDLLQYFTIFTRFELQDALELHKAIKERTNLKLIKQYRQSPRRKQIIELLQNMDDEDNEKALKNLQKLLKTETPPLLKKIYSTRLHGLNRLCADEIRKLEKEGFLIDLKNKQNGIMQIRKKYQINNSMPIYLMREGTELKITFLDNVLRNADGVAGYWSLLAIEQRDKNREESIIQHEVEHYIQRMLRLNLDAVEMEYGAFLAGVLFSKVNPFEAIYSGCISPVHNKAMKLIIADRDKKAKQYGLDYHGRDFTHSVYRTILKESHNDFYKKNIGITYTELENLCK